MSAGEEQIYRSIKFDRDTAGFSKWPKLSCSAATDANELVLATLPTPDDPSPGDARLAIAGELKLKTGVAVNQFSSNGTLVGNSDLTVPTEKAVKTYIDTQISQINSALSVKAALAGASSQDFQAKNLTVNGDLTTTGNVKAASFQGNGSGLDGVVKKAGDTITGLLTINNALTVSGNVGIGTIEPQGKLDVRGDIRAGNSDIYFTKTDHNHTGIGNTPGYAAIENAASHEALMILGRAGTSKGRSVRLWDYLQVNGNLDVTGNITGRVAGIGITVTPGLSNGASIPIPSGFTKQECAFFAFIKYMTIQVQGFNCFVDDGVVKITYSDASGKQIPDPPPPSPGGFSIFPAYATGVAIAKKGGW